MVVTVPSLRNGFDPCATLKLGCGLDGRVMVLTVDQLAVLSAELMRHRGQMGTAAPQMTGCLLQASDR
jgi:hypothetical protein